MKSNGNPFQLNSSLQSMDEVLLYYQEDIQSVENQIKESLSSSIPLVNNVFFHILQSGGKRLRPLLLIIASRHFNYSGKEPIVLGSVMEFIHTATLLHDDVVDEASLRRGKKANLASSATVQPFRAHPWSGRFETVSGKCASRPPGRLRSPLPRYWNPSRRGR